MVLMHHMDVVPAKAGEWSVPPFEGLVRDGVVWGRGSIDNKGGGVLTLMTVLLAKRLGTPLQRDVLLLAVADEEAGGGHGARFLTEQHMELFADVEFVMTEGGAVVEVAEKRFVYSVELAQKAPLWLRVTARGHSGHGGAPLPDSAVLALVRALSRLAAHRFPILVLPEVQALYAAKAAAQPEPLRKAYSDLRAALARPAFRAQFLKEPRDAALVQNTLAITMLAASDKENVIPGEASAVLDVRLLPGQDADAVIARAEGRDRGAGHRGDADPVVARAHFAARHAAVSRDRGARAAARPGRARRRQRDRRLHGLQRVPRQGHHLLWVPAAAREALGLRADPRQGRTARRCTS